MKLIHYIILRIILTLVLILTVRTVSFHVMMVGEVNDEVGDSLEDYLEIVIIRASVGEELPSKNDGSNNQYYLEEIIREYTKSQEDIQYRDSMIYIVEKEETEPVRILTAILEDDEGRCYELIVPTFSIEKDDLRSTIQIWIISLYVVLLLCVIVISVWASYRNVRPLCVLFHWLDNYQTGKKNKPLKNDTRVTESRKLNDATVRYIERTEQMFEQQEQFIGNVSHKIQAPLAARRSRLEMLVENDFLSEKQLRELMKTHQILEYIIKLNEFLLLLSKIDNDQLTDTKEVGLSVFFKQYLEDYREVYDYKNIEVSIAEQANFHITISESLAIALLTNLLKSAFVYSVDGGHIRIIITEHSVTSRSSGEKQSSDETHIFECFYQGHKKEGSTGLGSAITDSICHLQRPNLRYYFEQKEHCFEISSRNQRQNN